MSEGRISPEILELIRRTSTISGCDSIYSLAPRGHRVGFYFQQRRATLLARALKDRLGAEKLKSTKIAVIGAGVTGVSFFISLLHFGAEKVFLYESSENMFGTGSNARHRLVHPNYNRWPMLGSMDIFTSLPVLNWWAGTGEQVTRQLKSTVNTAYSDKLINRFRARHRCIELTQRGPELKMSVRVKFDCDGKSIEDDFEIAVLSVGFGDEACVAWGLEDYWTIERVPLDVGAHTRTARIFGTGDGALIDALRCCAKVPDDAWEIPLGVIARLRDQDASVLQEDRASGRIEPRTLRFSEWETEIQRHEESIRSASWQMVKRSDKRVAERYIKEEQNFYTNLVIRIQESESETCLFLEDRLKPVAQEALKPRIFGEIGAPFEPTSAPINKILMAYLLVTGRIVYDPTMRRADTEAELNRIKSADRAAAAATVEICRYGARRNFYSSGTTGGANAVSVQVEFDGGIKRHEETDLEGHLIDLLSGLSGGDYVYFDAMPHPLEVARNGHDKDSIIHSTRERFKPIIADFARSKLEADVELTNKPPKWIIKTAMSPEQVKEKLYMIGGIDGVFCGAPIVLSRTAIPEAVTEEGF